MFTAHLKASFASAVYVTENQCVRLSVCLSHCSIVSERGNTEGCINILAGDDPVPIEFGPKGSGTDRQYEGCTFHVSHVARF